MRPGLILQHEPSGPPAGFGAWLDRRSIPYEVHRAWTDEPLGDPRGHAWVCTLGSDQTPGRPGSPEWVGAEIDYLRRALRQEIPVLGLCFGGQALAAAAGAKVAASDPPQVGWISVESDDPGSVPAGPWLHFHYDQLLLPRAANELARSPAGTAAFRLGPHLGVQFHPEASAAIADRWAEAEAGTLARIGVDPEDLARDGRRCEAAAAAAAERLFDSWWAALDEPAGHRDRTPGAPGGFPC